MYGCESWTIKKAECQRIDAFELWCWRRLLRVSWTAGRSVNPKGNQCWIFIGRTDAEAEALVLWPPGGKSQLIGKDPDAGKDWGQEEKGTTEDEMAGWHHQLNGREFEWTPGVGDGQGGRRAAIHGVTKSWTRLSNWTELNWTEEADIFKEFVSVSGALNQFLKGRHIKRRYHKCHTEQAVVEMLTSSSQPSPSSYYLLKCIPIMPSRAFCSMVSLLEVLFSFDYRANATYFSRLTSNISFAVTLSPMHCRILLLIH